MSRSQGAIQTTYTSKGPFTNPLMRSFVKCQGQNSEIVLWFIRSPVRYTMSV